VTYAKGRADEISRRGDKEARADFRLLSRQVQYRGVGIYGAVADRMRFLDRQTMTLSADLGRKLAEGFLRESGFPKAIRKAVEEDDAVDVVKLASWGSRAFIGGEVSETEASCFREALHLDPVRSRMVGILARHTEKQNDTELGRLSRIRVFLEGDKRNPDLREAISTIILYEKSYRWVILAFERMLWLCRQDPSGSASYEVLQNDAVMEKVKSNLPKHASGLRKVLEGASSEEFRKDLDRLQDVKQFLEEAASSCIPGGQIVERIMLRHADVQRGKFDKGRRKMPWLEHVPNNRIALTSTRVGGVGFEATEASQIAAHPYRLSSADALIEASKKR